MDCFMAPSCEIIHTETSKLMKADNDRLIHFVLRLPRTTNTGREGRRTTWLPNVRVTLAG